MKIFVFDTKRYYFILSAARVLVITLALMLASVLTVNYILDTTLYAEVAAEAGNGGIIIIDAGHGGEDCGTIGVNGVYEKDLNLSIANTLGEQLAEAGFAVVYTRTEDKLLYTEEENIKGIRKISDLKNRVKVAEKYPGAMFVSIHMNSYSAEKYSGFQAYFKGDDSDSRMLADKVQGSVRSATQPDNDRAIKSGKNMYVLENSPIVSVLLECGFLSNREECEKLCEKEYQKQLSFAIVCGIIEYMEAKSE